MKPLLIVAALMVLLMVTPVIGLLPELCDETPTLATNCTVVTPAIVCNTFLYNITRLNTTTGIATQVVTNDNLSVWDTDLYYFNFTQTDSRADYVVRLCSGHTVQLSVGGEVVNFNMFILLPFLTAAVLLTISFQLNREHHETLRFIFGMFSFVSVFVGLWIAFIMNANFLKIGDLDTALATYLWFLGFVFMGILLYMTVYIFIRALKKMQDEKEDGLKY